MEVVCVLVLSLVTFVTSSPYGYGVKGGAAAIAKADASAAAGAFPGIGAVPLSIPSAGSYSGSYSKASSSSFAASSASSSSSSFTLTGSGTLPNAGYGANGITGNTKCTLGTCLTGSSGPTGIGSLGQSYSGANAAAGSGAIVFPGSYGSHTECSGVDCLSTSNCNGGNCGDKSSTDKKCTSGECEATPSTTTIGSNDIYVPTYQSKSPSVKPYDKITPTSSSLACTYGNCGATVSSSQKPSSLSFTDAYPSSTAYVNKPSPTLIAPKEEVGCTSPSCQSSSSSYDVKKPSSYNVPSNTVYSQNKISCPSGICGNNNELNSPIYPTTAAGCTNGNCGNSIQSTSVTPSKTINNFNGGYSDFVPLAPTGNPPKPAYSGNSPSNSPLMPTSPVTAGSHFSNYGPIKLSVPVTSTMKDKIPYTGGFGGPPGILMPNEFSVPPKIPASNYKPATTIGSSYKPVSSGPSTPPFTSLPSISCTSGNCDKETGSSSKPLASTSSYNPCSHGNCAGAGPSHPQGSSPSNSQYGSTLSQSPEPTVPSTLSPSSKPTTDCASGNCRYPSETSPQYGGSGTYKPSYSQSYKPSVPIGENKPTKPICTSGNCGNPSQELPQSQSEGTYNPIAPTGTYNPAVKPSQSPPQYDQNGLYQPQGPTGAFSSSGSYTPTVCSSGNCGSQPSPTTTTGSYKPPQPTASYSPNPSFTQQDTSGSSYRPTGSSSSSCSSGSCGSQSTPTFGPGSYKPTGPTGSYGPNPPLPQQDSSGSSYHPIAPSGSGCSSGNCGSQSTPTFGSGSYKPMGPAGSYGLNSPFPQQDTSDSSYHPIGPSSSGCSSGNCGSQSTPTFGPGSYKPTRPTGSYGLNPSVPDISGSYNNPSGLSSSYGPTVCTSANCGSLPHQPQQSSGDYSSSRPTGSYNPTVCSSGNCQQGQPAPHLGSQYNKPTIPSGSFNPSGSSSLYGPTACPSGDCAAYPNKPVIPSFGAPAGILKPNEFTTVPGSSPSAPGLSNGVISNSPSSNFKPITPTSQTGSIGNTPTGSHSSPCSSGNCGVKPSQPSSLYGQNTVSGSHASAGAAANAIAYTGGFGGPPGLLQPYDDGKLPSGISASGSQNIGNYGSAPGTYTHSSFGKSLNGANIGTGGNAQASAAAGAAAGSYGGTKAQGGDNNNASSGCNDGCNGASSGLGHSGAAAKSVSSAGAYTGSFASSSASAHASAGAATKGGYGKR